MSNNLDSPTTLNVKGEYKRLKRIGSKPMIIALFTVVVVMAIIMIFISHQQSMSLTRANAEKLHLTPATEVGNKINEKISDRANADSTEKPNVVGLQLPTANNNVYGAKLTQEREAKLKEAMESSTGVEQFKRTDANFQTQNPVATASSKGSLSQVPPVVPPLSGDDDQNKQAQKEAFLSKAAQNQYAQYLDSTRKAPISQLEIKTGTVIPSVLVTGINSDLPGQIIAQVSENVYDTATGRYLLIPQGTKIYGAYDSHVAYGQQRLLVAWQRLIFPDASTIELEGISGADKGGYAGFNDQVNNHYARLIGFGLATAVFSSLFQISQEDNNSNNGQLTSSQIAAATTAQSITQLGIDVTRKNLNIQPTLEIRPGYRFIIMVNKDVIFPSVYCR